MTDGQNRRGFGKLVHTIGLDFHVFATLLFRGWSVLAGGTTAVLIPLFLTPDQQGYYYTFMAVLGTQIFFELGLNHVLTQQASHNAAHLTREANGRWHGPSEYMERIASLFSISTRWYSFASVVFFVAIFTGGFIFFSAKEQISTAQWVTVWAALSFLTAINLLFSARLAIIEGLGEVGQVARLRLRQSAVGYVCLWLLLVSGGHLWSAIAVPATSAAMTLYWLRAHKKSIALPATQTPSTPPYRWRKDIFPLQWRIAVSWASGYFIFTFLVPMVFARQGAVEAGRLGLALTIFSSISSVGMSWVNAKLPEYAKLIATKQKKQLDALFKAQFSRSTAATAAACVLFLLAAYAAGLVIAKVQERLPSLEALLLLAATTVVNSVIFSFAAYMRAHKEEPLVVQSVTVAVIMAVGIFVSSGVSLTVTIATYCAITVLISAPWTTIIFRRYRQRTLA